LVKDRFKTPFARDIFYQKYAQGSNDTWDNLCERLVNDVCGNRSCSYGKLTADIMSKDDQKQLVEYLKDMKVIFGGRYLYYAGRPASFWNNCFCLKAEEDTREEWAAVAQRSTSALMSARVLTGVPVAMPETLVLISWAETGVATATTVSARIKGMIRCFIVCY